MSLSTQQIIIGTGVVTTSGNTLYVNGVQVSSSSPAYTASYVDYPSGLYVVNWGVSTSFQYTLTGSTTFSFTGLSNGQTIVLAIYNTGGYTCAWPSGGNSLIPVGVTGIKWPSGLIPTQSVSGKTDVYTFVDVNNVVYGNVIQGF